MMLSMVMVTGLVSVLDIKLKVEIEGPSAQNEILSIDETRGDDAAALGVDEIVPDDSSDNYGAELASIIDILAFELGVGSNQGELGEGVVICNAGKKTLWIDYGGDGPAANDSIKYVIDNGDSAGVFTNGEEDPREVFLRYGGASDDDYQVVVGYTDPPLGEGGQGFVFDAVFIAVIDIANEESYFVQFQELNHALPDDHNEWLLTGTAGDVPGIDLDYQVTDGAGASVQNTITHQVLDDGPIANPDLDAAVLGTETTGNVITGVDGDELSNVDELQADDPGKDGAAAICAIEHNGIVYTLSADGQSVSASDMSNDHSYDPVEGKLTITSALGATFTIDLLGADIGLYSYQAPDGGDAESDIAYTVHDGKLHAINLEDGTVTEIGPVAENAEDIEGLTYNTEDMLLYGLNEEGGNTNESLVSIDPADATTVIIKDMDVTVPSDKNPSGLGFDSTADEMYAVAGRFNSGPDSLWTVDETSGDFTEIDTTAFEENNITLAALTADDSGQLWGIEDGNNTLWQVNSVDGMVSNPLTITGMQPDADIEGAAWGNAGLWLIDKDSGNLYNVDTGTGAVIPANTITGTGLGDAGFLNPNDAESLAIIRGAAGEAPEGPEVFTYTLKDGDGDTDTTTLTINLVEDSEPFAPNIKACVTENIPEDVLLLLITDASTSMTFEVGNSGMTRGDMVNAAWDELLTAWGASDNVAAVLVAQFDHEDPFDTDFLLATKQSGWYTGTSAANILAAQAYINGVDFGSIPDDIHYTNYAQGLVAGILGYGDDSVAPLPDFGTIDKSYAYFITDGVNNFGIGLTDPAGIPYLPGDETLENRSINQPGEFVGIATLIDDVINDTTWLDFLAANNFNGAYAIGAGLDATTAASFGLPSIAYNSDGDNADNFHAVTLSDLSDLGETLVDTTNENQKMVMGNILDYVDFGTDGPDDSLADSIVSITVQGTGVFSYDGDDIILTVEGEAPVVFEEDTSFLELDDFGEGLFSFDFGGLDAGKFKYIPDINASLDLGSNMPMVEYTIRDASGDEATGTIAFDVQPVEKDEDGNVIDECTCDELIASEIFTNGEQLIYLGGPEDNNLFLESQLSPEHMFDGGDGYDAAVIGFGQDVNQTTLDGLKNIEFLDLSSNTNDVTLRPEDVLGMTDGANRLDILGEGGINTVTLTGDTWQDQGDGVYVSGAGLGPATVEVQDINVTIVV